MVLRSSLLRVVTSISLPVVVSVATPIASVISVPVAANAADLGCPAPVLSRLSQHKVASGETLQSIAQKYDLVPGTIMGFNPSTRSGKVIVGSRLVIPPFNGIRIEVSAGQTWREIGARYRVRPDLLYELNGCRNPAQAAFVPGVTWSPSGVGAVSAPVASAATTIGGYPLAKKGSVLLKYGWYVPAGKMEPVFHSGIDLEAQVASPVKTIADGTVAFAGSQGVYGNLVVINHTKGYQTRYAQLGTIAVKVGQVVKQGATIGTVGNTGTPSSLQPHLHFEVRSNSNLGWVAEDPAIYLK